MQKWFEKFAGYFFMIMLNSFICNMKENKYNQVIFQFMPGVELGL